MPKLKPPNEKRPTWKQHNALKVIARSCLIKTYRSTKLDPVWTADGIEIEHSIAKALILYGWVIPQRDGLGMFEETQTYVVRKPIIECVPRRKDDSQILGKPVPAAGEVAAPLLSMMEIAK